MIRALAFIVSAVAGALFVVSATAVILLILSADFILAAVIALVSLVMGATAFAVGRARALLWHPARSVSVCAGAQMLKTELMLNTMFTIIATRPMPMMLVLPSPDEVLNWNRTKWRPSA